MSMHSLQDVSGLTGLGFVALFVLYVELAILGYVLCQALHEIKGAIHHLRFNLSRLLDERDDLGAVGAFGSVVLVAIVVTAGALAFVSLQPTAGTERVDVEATWVPVNVSGTEERWDGHVLRVDALLGEADRAEAVLVHNGTRYAVDVHAGAEVWLPCPSTANPSSSLAVDGERATWHANLPCHAHQGGGAPSTSTEDPDATDSEIGDCQRSVWVGGDELASTPCLVGGST